MAEFLNFLMDPNERKKILAALLDSANRGMVAGTLGAPVDVATQAANLGIAGAGYAGHKLGLLNEPPELIDPSHAIGSSEWIGRKMQERGIVSPNRNEIAEMGMAMLSPVAARGGAAVGRSVAKADLAAAENAAKAGRVGPISGQRGAVAWHGTPHNFDEFDASKIGTGEGAQAFGHGLYFAQSKDVASGYRTRLAPSISYMRDADKTINSMIDDALQVLPKNKHNQAIARVPSMAGWLRGSSWDEAADRMLAKAKKSKGATKSALESDASLARELGSAGVENRLSGRLYQVDIEDDVIGKMIDWDKGGEAIWKNAVNEAGSAQAASDLLSSKGITGIRYLDSGSRAVKAGTTNYVVFPRYAKDVRITSKE